MSGSDPDQTRHRWMIVSTLGKLAGLLSALMASSICDMLVTEEAVGCVSHSREGFLTTKLTDNDDNDKNNVGACRTSARAEGGCSVVSLDPKLWHETILRLSCEITLKSFTHSDVHVIVIGQSIARLPGFGDRQVRSLSKTVCKLARARFCSLLF